MKKIFFNLIILFVIGGILMFVVPVINGQDNGMEMEDSKMGHMKMYNPVVIDGCTDFHCQICTDRNKCSMADQKCNHPNCGHEHGAIMCHQGILFYLRESQGFKDNNGHNSCYTRAEFVADQLNKMMNVMSSHENSYFTVLDQNRHNIKNESQTPIIWFTMVDADHWNKVISVTPGDLAGYKYRASLPNLKMMAMPPERLTKKLVAQWWAYTLKDHFSMMVLNEKPRLTTYTHCGKALLALWKQARAMVPTGKISMEIWKQAVNKLSDKEKSHLLLAAQIVPENFDPTTK